MQSQLNKTYFGERKFEPRNSEHDLRHRHQHVLRHNAGELQFVGRVGRMQGRRVQPAEALAHAQHVHAPRAQIPFPAPQFISCTICVPTEPNHMIFIGLLL